MKNTHCWELFNTGWHILSAAQSLPSFDEEVREVVEEGGGRGRRGSMPTYERSWNRAQEG